jgi:tetratricopeptide (TPR) repeat protein
VAWILAAAVVVWAWSARAADPADQKDTKEAPKESSGVRPEIQMRERLDRASEAFQHGRFEDARKDYEAATKEDPGNMRAWVGLGWSYWQLGDRQKALKTWNDLLKVNPGDTKILLALGQAHEAMGSWKEALDYYDGLLKKGAEQQQAHLGRARVLEQMQRWSEAEKEYRIFLKEAPGDPNAQFALARVLLVQKRRPEAEAILRQLAAKSPEPKYLRILGDGMLQLGRYDEAENYYRKSLEREPDHRGTVLSLSRAYARDHRYDDAVAVLKPFVDRHPGDEQAREELARAAANAGNVVEAERQFRVLIQKHPDDDQWAMRLAKMYRAVGRSDEGVAVAREVVQRNPKDVDALGFLADDAQLSGNFDEAIRLLDELAAVQPIPSRLSQLGRLHILRAQALADRDDKMAADAEFRAAAQAFSVASKIDPTDSDPVLGMVTAQRLSGQADVAAAEAERVLQQHPNLEAMRLEAIQSYMQLEQFDDAERHLLALLNIHPRNVGLEQQLAMLDFNEGQREDAVARLEGMLKNPLNLRVPVLLYHGISRAPRTPSAMPVQNFRDQMMALQRAGYQPITLEQFIDFAEGRGQLPPKPIFITFDDARADTIENGDPVLKEMGFHAAMFIPTGEIGLHGAYYAPWRTLNDLYRTGRWDMQCHANLGHRTVPVDAQGHEGRFFSDRQWLADQNRLETEAEFAKRIDDDYRTCREVLESRIPGEKAVAWAYPFGDLGQRRFTNEPNAVQLNVDSASKYYRAAFVEAPFGMASPAASHMRFPRYEMAPDSKGDDLLRLLTIADPENSTLYLLAQFYAWSGRFAEANAIYDNLESRGYDKATLLVARAQAQQWNGNFGAARDLYSEALAMNPNDPNLQRKVQSLDLQVAPTVGADGMYYSDNSDRRNYSVGPTGKFYLTDRFSIAATYQYREFLQDNFNLSRLAAPSGSDGTSGGTTGTAPTPGTTTAALTLLPPGTTGRAKLKTTGHEVQGQLEYQVDARTAFSIAGGIADFDDKSSPKVLPGPNPDPYPVVSGRAAFGLTDYSDIAVGGSHGYVPAAGTILDGTEYSGGQLQVRLHPLETWTLFGQGLGEYYDGGNDRIAAVGRLTKLVWRDPAIELGYQFLYDDAKEENPFFYTPNRFIGNEAVIGGAFGSGKPLRLEIAGTVGEGSEKGGSIEFEGSIVGGLRLQITPYFGLLVSGGRTQAANFSSYETRGSLQVKF